jgi:hypothetical protein
MNKYRIVTNGHKYKIQHRSIEGFIFKKEVWNDMGKIRNLCLVTTYYDTLIEAKRVFESLIDYDKKLTDWTVVKV